MSKLRVTYEVVADPLTEDPIEVANDMVEEFNDWLRANGRSADFTVALEAEWLDP